MTNRRSRANSLTAFEAFYNGAIFGGELIQSLYASLLAAHLDPLLDCQLPPLCQAEGNILPLLLCAEGQAADVDGHYPVDLFPVEERKALLLEVHVDLVINAVFDRFQDLPDLSASPGEFAEENNIDMVILCVGEAFLETGTFAVLLSPADVLLESAFHRHSSRGSISEK